MSNIIQQKKILETISKQLFSNTLFINLTENPRTRDCYGLMVSLLSNYNRERERNYEASTYYIGAIPLGE